ncbi:MAG: hypothetical protein RL701_2879 [Pseudomonadota bacterium]|jgi:Cdc6-like AAA superfamily ATPase
MDLGKPSAQPSLRDHQPALRGSMIVVACAKGTEKTPTVLVQGVCVIEGRTPEQAGIRTHFVRHIPSPTSAHRAADAIGITLDGDTVVFGTVAGALTKMRLDGSFVWKNDLPQNVRAAGRSLLWDSDGDGILDIVVPVVATCKNCDAAQSVLVALDGKTGALLRYIREPRWNSGPDSACRDAPVITTDGDNVSIACEGVPGLLYGPRLEALGADSAALPDRSLLYQRDTSEGAPLFSVSLSDKVLTVSQESGERRLPLWSRPLQGQRFGVPVLGDVDSDKSWDIVVVTDTELVVIPTDSKGPAPRAEWPGNLTVPVTDSIAAYASRALARDQERWLSPDGEPGDPFELLAGIDRRRTFDDPANVLRRLPVRDRGIENMTACQGRIFGLSEGRLVLFEGMAATAAWRRVPSAPWPADGLGCDSRPALGGLIVQTPRLAYYRLPAPVPLLPVFGIAGALILAPWLFAITAGRRAGAAVVELPPDVRRIVLSDVPIASLDDAVPSQRRLVVALKNTIDNSDTAPPLTIALHGRWGTGKSSIMQMLRGELQGTARYVDVWFNAWRFHRESQLAPALLQSIVDAIEQQSDWVTKLWVAWSRVRTASVRTILSVVVPGLALAFVFYVCVGAAAQAPQSVNVAGTLGAGLFVLFGTWWKVVSPVMSVFSIEPAKLLGTMASRDRLRFVKAFSRELHEVMGRLPKDSRLIVFVDDLDRCAPERVVEVLETINMLSETGAGYFVMAVDAAVARRAVEYANRDLLAFVRTQDQHEADSYGARYLEKMVTLGVNVPQLRACDFSPEARLSQAAPRTAVPRWVPGASWLWACLTVGLGIGVTQLATLPFGGLSGVTDKAKVWLVAAAVNETSVSAAHTGTNSTPTPGAQPSERSAPTVRGSQAPDAIAAIPVPEDRGVAAVHDAQPKLDIVTDVAKVAPTPAAALSASRLLAELVSGLSLIAAFAIMLYAWERTNKLKAQVIARPKSTDSTVFAEQLSLARAQLPPANPRNVVRFTNSARLLYQLVAVAKPDQANDAEPWEPAFFALVRAHWLGTATANVPAPEWLRVELSAWLS